MYNALQLRLGKRRVYAIELGRKQVHQVIVQLKGDIGPFNYDDKVMINLNTNEVTIIERIVYDKAA